MSSPPIAILGAGPSGLVLARLLELAGIDYVVFERDADARAVFTGGTLDIHADDGQHVLKEAGLFDKFEAEARYAGQAFKAVDKDLNEIWDKKYDGQRDRPEIDRTALRQLLLDSIPAHKIRWSSRVDSVFQDPLGQMTIQFSNASSVAGFSLVVGADGAWSKARPLITSAEPIYSEYHYLQTSITPSNPDYATIKAFAGVGSYIALTGGAAIMAQMVGSGTYNVYVGLSLPKDWSKQNAELMHSQGFGQYLLDTYFSDWADEPVSLIRASNGEWHSWPLYHLPMECMPWKSVPGVTLVGDAAHLSIPNGEGVNCAMFDSYELAKEIIKFGTDRMDQAVQAYEQGMFHRGRASIEKGQQVLDMFFASDAPRAFISWVAEVKVMIAKMEAEKTGRH